MLSPLLYFLQGQRLLRHEIETKTAVKAELVTQIASRSPDVWRYQSTRLLQLLTQPPAEIGGDFARVVDDKGTEVLSVGAQPSWPVFGDSRAIMDAGVMVGHVQVSRSMRVLLAATLGIALLGMGLGALVFLTLRTLPLRSLQSAMSAIAKQLHHQEKIALFGRSMLGKHTSAEMIEEAVQIVLEGLAADAVAYVEPGPGEREIIVHTVRGLPRQPTSAVGNYVPQSLIAGVLELGKDAYFTRPESTPTLPFEWAHAMHAGGLVEVPGDACVRGALCAFNLRPRTFGAEEAAFLEAVASVLSSGLLRGDKEDRLAYLAQFDTLTGLPNRALLHDRFSQMIVQARRRGTSLGVLFVDLDEFKQINDTLGHAAGDELLKQTASRLQSSVRSGDTVARISGDEFAIILSDLARPDEAALVAQKLIEGIAAPYAIGGQEVFVTASIGIAGFPGDGSHAEELISAADAAMYRAKQSGRNAYQFYTAELNEQSRARAQLTTDLRRALEQEEFALVYQPKVALDTQRACGAEALLRWRHPQRGVVSPAEFIPALEESGLIVAVGEWVLRRVCSDLKAWKAANLPVVPIAVNLSARQFRQPELDARIISLLQAEGIDPAQIELEITESQLMQDPDQAIRMMRALRDAGLRIAIDDFGTGYSSLSYLTRFPIAALKIDRSFVTDANTDASNRAIVKTVVDMAHTLGFTVVAEGVETEAQAALLHRMGCDQAQGYHFARPLSVGDFTAYLGAHMHKDA